MAVYISFQPSDFFSTTLYTGTGAELAVTGVGFEPNFTWIKDRDGLGYHNLFDTARGATKRIFSNVTNTENTEAQSLKSWQSDGFTVGTHADCNTSGNDIVSWNWKMGTTTGIAGSPSITPTSYSFDQTAAQSVITYTGNGTSGATIPHGLGVIPECVLVKNLSSTDDWQVYFTSLGGANLGANKYFILNTSARDAVATNRWNDTAPTTTLFSLGSAATVNGSGNYYVAYCFKSVNGYASCGSYLGNGNPDGPFIYTGFRPAYVMTKRTAGTGDWYVYDDKRLGYNADNNALYADLTNVESTSEDIDILSNGFKLRTSNSEINNTERMCYIAFAEFPLVSSNSKPGTAR